MNVRWVRRVLWFAGFGCLWLSVLDDPPLRTGAYVQDVTATSASVAIVTAQPTQVACTVRNADGTFTKELRSTSQRRRHVLRFEGLQPGTSYRYSLADLEGGGVEEGSIRTAPVGDGAEVRFAFVGDSGDPAWWVWVQRTPAMHWAVRQQWLPGDSEVTRVGEAMAAYGPEFVLHLGDVVYPWGRHAQYPSAFVRPFAEVMRNSPLYAVLGNHDVMDSDGVQLLSNLHLPANEDTGDGRCFSFAWGPVRVIGLDCNTDRVGRRFDAQHPSARFLARELAERTEPWVVVASHFPIRSQSRQRDRADLLLSMMPSLKEHGVSIYLSGHDHCYQRFDQQPEGDGVPLLVSGGGGKSLYDVRPGRAAKVESSYHWCSVEAREARMTIRAHRLDGTVIEAVELVLPEGQALDGIRTKNPGRADRIKMLRNR